MSKRTINDEDRRLWVLNDEGLYNLMRDSRLGTREFIRQNRKLIDEVIGNVSSGARRQHYLVYG
jgi:hypothetical protein